MINGSFLSSMHRIQVTPESTLSALTAELHSHVDQLKQPVLLVLPPKPVPILTRPDDFRPFKRLKRELDINIFFVIPGNATLRKWAQQAGFPTYSTQEELGQALDRGQLRSLALHRTGKLVTRSLAPGSSEVDQGGTSSSLDSSRGDGILPAAAPAPESIHRFEIRDYVEGECLEDYLTRHASPMEESAVLAIWVQLLETLENLEGQSLPIVHGDIRPANIVINARDNRVHLIGFPELPPEGEDAEGVQESRRGTTGYASPEQVQGEADSRSDLYSLAASMHRLLTGHDPAEYPPHNYPPVTVINPRISPGTERLLARALTFDPTLRYQSAAEMKREVEALLLVPKSTTQVALHAVALETQPGPALSSDGKPPPPPQASRPQRHWKKVPGSLFRSKRRWFPMIALLLIVVVVVLAVSPFMLAPRLHGTHSLPVHPLLASTLGIGVTKAPDGETIGLSDAFAFDTEVDRPDRQYLLTANAAYHNDIGQAETLWTTAAQEDTSDPQPKIYLENQRALTAGTPYIDLVVGTMESGKYVSLGRWDLQGAYLAQREYNNGCRLPGCTLVRILVASTGNQPEYAVPVARQIVTAARQDPHLLGVMGWPYSSRTLDVVPILTAAHLPLVSQMASSVALSGISPYFFRTVPNDTAQARAGAQYIQQHLHAQRAILFFDPQDSYSASIGEAFKRFFLQEGNRVIGEYHFTAGTPTAIPDELRAAMASPAGAPDFIYFAGVAPDASVLLADLPVSGPFGQLTVWGGDGLYEIGAYAPAARVNFHRLRFTAFAYPDTWGNLGLQHQLPEFFADYPTAFDPYDQHTGGPPYGFRRADGDAILSYDATVALLEAYQLAFQQTHGQVRTVDLRQALSEMHGARAFQGATGQIAFGANGDAVNKAVVILSVAPQGTIAEVGVAGQFLKNA